MEVMKGYKHTEVGVIPVDWQVRKIKDVGSKFMHGGTPSTTNLDYWKGDIPWVTGADITKQSVNLFRRFITKEAVKNSSTNVVEQGNLLLVTRTGVGKMAIAPTDIAISQDITGIYPNKEVNIEYLYRYLDFNSDRLKLLNQGTSIAGITRDVLLSTNIALPPTKSEQSAIAAVLSETDSLITNLEKLITKKEAVKKGTMQALLTGKKRLPGFNSKWQKKKIKRLFKFLSTANNSRSELSDEGEIGYIHYGDIHTRWSEFLDVSTESIPFIKKYKIKDVPFLENGDLLIADASEDYEGLCACIELKNVNHREIVGGLHTLLLRGNKDEIADGFKGYLLHLNGFKEAVIRAATGISVYGISKKNLGEIEIIIPDTNEQSSIAAVIADMTTEIKQLEEKLQKYKVIKQGMMQNLLTGKIRLV